MTEQIRDRYLYQKEEYELLEHPGQSLFSPEPFGMEPVMMHTGCWRGYYAEYEIVNDAIYLNKLTIRDRNGKYVPIGGVIPEKAFVRPDIFPQEKELNAATIEGKTVYYPENSATSVVYSNMSFKLPFTGKIRLAKDTVVDVPHEMNLLVILLYEASRYRTVIDLTIDEGTVVQVVDRSQEIESRRKQYIQLIADGQDDIEALRCLKMDMI